MAVSLIKALTVLIVLQLVIIVAVLIIDIMILKNQNNAADTTTNANLTDLFSTTTTVSNNTITTPTTTIMTTTTTESKNIATTSTIDTTIPTSSSTPEIVLSTSSIASVTLSAIDTTTTTTNTTTTTRDPITTTTIPTRMTDCYDWLHINNATLNGIYQINPGYGLEPFDVYCDMTTDGGGWTVIQRQVDDSSEMWKNTWQQYKNGFNYGLENGSLWLGNDRIYVMTSRWNVTLRVEIYGNRRPNHTNPNIYLYGKYSFSISDEINNYTLQISLPIDGNASDSGSVGFIYNNGMPFSTVDKSSNDYGSICANTRGAWWLHWCGVVSLNGKYNGGFIWYSETTSTILPYHSKMKIRRQQ